MTTEGRPHRGGWDSLRRRLFSPSALVSLAVASGLLVFLVTRFDVDLGVMWERVRDANPWLLTAAFLVHYTTFFARGARWRMLLQHTADPGTSVPGVVYCSQLVLLGWFVNSIGWLRLGDAFRAYLYQEEQKATFSGTIGTLLAERVLDTVLVVVLLIIVAPFLVDRNDNATWSAIGVVVFLAAVLVAFLAVMARARGLVARRSPRWLAIRYERFHQGTMGSFRRLPLVTFWGLLGWAAEVGRMYLVVLALGFELSLPLVVFLTLANSLLSLVPTPGGIGAVETGVAGLAVRLSALASSAAAALVLVDRSISYISVILVGGIIFAGRWLCRKGWAPSRAGLSPPKP